LAVLLLLHHGGQVEGRIYQLVRDFVQYNVGGIPLTHQTQTYDFDPDIALKRREQFVELNGDKSEKLIERIGLGVDGKQQERLAAQQARDEGHLNGINYFLP
jgi:hypothetical protein